MLEWEEKEDLRRILWRNLHFDNQFLFHPKGRDALSASTSFASGQKAAGFKGILRGTHT